MKEWFDAWFDSPYYHTLYAHRSYEEADAFVQKLVEILPISPGARVLDLACGKGRHAAALHKHGFEVTGMDLSTNSIAAAQKLAQPGLNFVVGDMRHFRMLKQQDAVLNLFTSFGYFDDIQDNHRVLKRVHDQLTPGGIFVIDFLNAEHVKQNLVRYEVQVHEGIRFELMRNVRSGFVVKDIHFSAEGVDYHFQEKVQLFSEPELRNMLLQHGYTIWNRWGDYQGKTYNPYTSPRTILFVRV